MGLANCEECGKVFVKSMDKFCPACVKKRTNEIETINDWISKKAEPKLVNFNKETGISQEIFFKYLLDGRLRSFSKVIAPCDVCGKETKLITKNVLCNDCKNQLKKSQSYKKKGDLEDSEMYSKKDKFK